MTTTKKYYGMRSPVLHPSITQEIIDTATRNNSSHCMIADTIREQYPKFTHIAVDLQTIRFTDKEKKLRYIYLTPRVAQQALVLFDEGKRMRPFEFNLRGAHVVAANVSNRAKGRSVRERLNLGRRRILTNSRNHNPDVIGGQPPPKHPSASAVRTFGMRAFTRNDLEEVGIDGK